MERDPLARAALPLLAVLAAAGALHAQDPPPEGFRTLFNGEDLSGWWGLGTEDPRGWQGLEPEALREKREASLADVQAHWRVEDGVLVNDGQGLYLTTDEDFGDFELLVDYRTVARADSGIYLRGLPQVQIWDTTEAGGKWNIGADKGSGGLWNNGPGAAGKDPLVHADRPFGEWNHFRIVMVGERVTVWLNDALVVDHARLENYFDRGLPAPRHGPIQLQTHGGEIRWRNVFVRPIEAEEANELLRRGGPARAEPAAGYEPIFNGRDLSGWAGPTDGYEVREGSIRCRAGHGGTIYTEEEYGDFAVELEILLPPGATTAWPSATPAAATRPTSACASCRCSTTPTPSTPGWTRASTTAPPTVRPRPTAATCGRPASGTSSA